MSAKFYDKAITAKIKSLFNNTIYQRRELTFHTVTDKQGEVTFPLISIYRPDGWNISSDNTWLQEKEFIKGVREIKLDLTYQIDVYANTREDLEDITAELVLYLLRNRGIVVHYESYDKSVAMDVKTYLNYVSGPENTSEPDDKIVGRPYRYTLVYSLDAAKLLNFAGTKPGQEGYVSKVTTVLVDIVETEISVDASGEIHKTDYIDKEEVYGKD